MIEKVIKEVSWYVDRVCSYVPLNYRDDVKQDIYLKILIELGKREEETFEDNVTFCFTRIQSYKRQFFKKYLNNKVISVENIENLQSIQAKDYTITLDLDKVWDHLTDKQKKLLVYLLNNGIDSTYEEIKDAMGYKNISMGLWSVRLLLQKIKRILEGEKGHYKHEERYVRYKKI